ncbi:MAG: TVP38/TMEM64 family protein, partial [Hyphomicrobium sp.]
VIGTLIGIIPGTAAFSFAGAGLGSVVEAQNKIYQTCLAGNPENPDVACPYMIDKSALITNELLAAFALMGVVSLIPVALKYFRGRHAQG